MAKVAIYTLTRDRLEYTKYNFTRLKEMAKYPYDHFIVDNGSKDGTVEWLNENKDQFKDIHFYPENEGISTASNKALDMIKEAGNYDLIIKMDNDCEVNYDGIIERIVRLYDNMPPLRKMMLSPRVEGINNQPHRYLKTMIDDCEIGLTSMVGGLFHIIPGELYQQFRHIQDLPLASRQDDEICQWFKALGGEIGYIEPIVVNHYETTNGQAQRFPEYFERKFREEVTHKEN